MSRKQTSSKSPQIAKSIHKQSKDSDSSSSERRYGKFWKPNEDSLLLELHNRHNGNWKLIAEGIPGRNLSQCQQRWKRINPNKVFLHLFFEQTPKIMDRFGRPRSYKTSQ
ncbi:unnamed protein product [Paramecium octaurelia]|uniref:Uncharacterized protein n=1 Tax=Paramecium octaurelia TaxID=43137 RepID=A0A8S1UPB3_PAROT|nr:unnamed protein product [Paramecium octaurelia]